MGGLPGEGVLTGTARAAGPEAAAGVVHVVVAAQLLNAVNLSSVNLMLPAIAANLAFDEATLQWVSSSYALAFAGFVLLGGRLADLRGGRKLLVIGFATCTVGALGSAVTPVGWGLLAARFIQGAGTALAVPAALEVIGRVTAGSPAARARGLAAYASAGAVGVAIGLILGGVMTELAGWRWVFGLVAAVAAMLALLVLRIVPARADAAGRVDMLGAPLSIAGLTAIALGVSLGGSTGWTAPATYVVLISGVVLVGLFVLVQARSPNPLMPLSLWSAPGFGVAVVSTVFLYGAWSGTLYSLSLILQNILGMGALAAGFALLPLAVGGAVASRLARFALRRIEPTTVMLLGGAVSVVGIAVLTMVGPGTSYVALVPAFLAVAMGQVLAFVAANIVALSSAAEGSRGLAGGVFVAACHVGVGLAVAVMATVSDAVNRGGTGLSMLGGFRAALWAAAGMGGLSVLVLALRRRGARMR